jgi:hypothetical protein
MEYRYYGELKGITLYHEMKAETVRSIHNNWQSIFTTQEQQIGTLPKLNRGNITYHGVCTLRRLSSVQQPKCEPPG